MEGKKRIWDVRIDIRDEFSNGFNFFTVDITWHHQCARYYQRMTRPFRYPFSSALEI